MTKHYEESDFVLMKSLTLFYGHINKAAIFYYYFYYVKMESKPQIIK